MGSIITYGGPLTRMVRSLMYSCRRSEMLPRQTFFQKVIA